MLRGKYLRERKALRTKRRFKSVTLITIILVLYKLIFGTLSVYNSDAYSSADVDVAYFVVRDEYSSDAFSKSNTIKLDSLEPGESLTVTIALYGYDNTEEKNPTQTDMKYKVTIRTTTNIDYDYKIYYEDDSTKNYAKTDLIEKDDDDTYFRYLVKSDESTTEESIFEGVFEHDQRQSRTYKLKITMPSKYDNAKYQNIMDAIEVKVEAQQVIE